MRGIPPLYVRPLLRLQQKGMRKERSELLNGSPTTSSSSSNRARRRVPHSIVDAYYFVYKNICILNPKNRNKKFE
jgi:hypothetical protein